MRSTHSVDESVGLEQTKITGHTARESAAVRRIVFGFAGEHWPQVPVADALQSKLAAQEEGKAPAVVRADGLQGPIGPRAALRYRR
ncbi:MAG: hypothetical protein ACRD1N_02395 [Terriglobia bacterium]